MHVLKFSLISFDLGWPATASYIRGALSIPEPPLLVVSKTEEPKSISKQKAIY